MVGVVKGLGRQKKGMAINFAGNYLFLIPLALYFTFFYSQRRMASQTVGQDG